MKLQAVVTRADWGDGAAEPGSEPWAKRWRLDMQNAVDRIEFTPKELESCKEYGERYSAWRVLKDAEGAVFLTWESFCSTPRPHGLGTDPSRITAALALRVGKKGAELLTVAPAPKPVGRAGKEDHSGPSLSATNEKRLRAIAERAPEQIRDLYRADLIGVKEAAALGKKNPTPEHAAKQTMIAIEAKRVASETKDKKQVNAYVRTALDIEPDPVDVAARAIAKVPHKRLPELLAKLSPLARRGLRE